MSHQCGLFIAFWLKKALEYILNPILQTISTDFFGIIPFILIDKTIYRYRLQVMVFNATFNNNYVISWWSVLLVEETGVPGENQRPAASH